MGAKNLVASTRSSRLLGFAARVDVRGVYEVDAGVDRTVDLRDAVVVIRVAHGAVHHRPEAQLAHGDAGLAELAILHGAHVTVAP
jgi:hypothetical protein